MSYEYARVNIEFFTERQKIKQQRVSFVLGYLRMLLWKISTAISIKHRILATFNIKKKSILTAYMPLTANNEYMYIYIMLLLKYELSPEYLN